MTIAGYSLFIYLDAAILGYLLGSIPFGLVLTRMAGLGDIRAIGSGNIGATNVLRTGNKALAVATLLLDGGKGALAVIAVKLLFPDATILALVAGIAAVIGHNFPVWLKFKGGKGVATTFGLMLGAAPLVGVAACATWLVAALIFRISSLSALIGLALAPVYAWATGQNEEAVAFAVLGALGWVRHAANIQRLLKGEEPRIGAKK